MAWSLSCFNRKKHHVIFLCWQLRFCYKFPPSYYRNVDNITYCVYSVRKDGTMHKSKGVTPMQQYTLIPLGLVFW